MRQEWRERRDMGHGAWCMGHGAWGMWCEVRSTRSKENSAPFTLLPLMSESYGLGLKVDGKLNPEWNGMKRNGWEDERRPTLHFAGSFNARGHLNGLQRQPSCKLQPNHCTTTQKQQQNIKVSRAERKYREAEGWGEKQKKKNVGKPRWKTLWQTKAQATGADSSGSHLGTPTHWGAPVATPAGNLHTQKWLKGLSTNIFLLYF